MTFDGFLYCLYSKDNQKNTFFQEFIHSLNSLKKVLPSSNVTLYTNIIFENNYEIDQVIFDKDIPKAHIAKAKALLNSPYEKTIFLDTDTIIHRDIINDIFNVLDEFEFTCCYANSNGLHNGNQFRGTIYPDLNTGLLGVKNNTFTKKQLKIWISNYKGGQDQISFRNEIFMKNKSEFHILPTYFQFRWHIYWSYPTQAVITHDHDPSKKKVALRIINSWRESLSPNSTKEGKLKSIKTLFKKVKKYLVKIKLSLAQ